MLLLVTSVECSIFIIHCYSNYLSSQHDTKGEMELKTYITIQGMLVH